ncbi:MAG: hypothetical protein IPH66_17035 [Crocinitomicaceae bacterium]|nr:hypothetical protein [Crocinitomicaceae bacterium]
MKLPVCILLLFCEFVVHSQRQDNVDARNFDYVYLEHLIKTGVDEVRKNHGCEPLINDSILYVASSFHAQYMVRTGMLSHTEDQSDSTKNPQDRVNYFGATNYRVGENILFTPYNRLVRGKDGSEFDTRSYQGLADAMVNAWVNSPGHFKNIITPSYQLTGLAISLDTLNKRVFACQKFAIADYQYSFTENKTMFPYSDYSPKKLVDSFNHIERILLEDYEYEFDLRHDKPENCYTCNLSANDRPFITLRIENNNFILRIEDANYVKNLLNKRFDGFAVEIVSFDDYMCGNPAYYTKPSRRNGQTMLNGYIIKPLFKKDLYKGFKKRKVKRDVRFLSYIFQADSVDFFNRFGKYKLERYSHEYFEVSLGRVPRNIHGYWAHNLIYIQNEQICRFDVFTGYCGEIIQDYQPTDFIPASADDHCYIQPESRSLHFSIPFEKGKYEFTRQDIEPFIQSLDEIAYSLDSVHIHAYSSIEGDSITNYRLQIKRAESIMSVLLQNQEQIARVRVTTSTDWKGFYKAVSNSSKWKYLSSMSQSEVLSELTKIGFDAIEDILKMERRGEIDLYCSIHPTDENLEYFIAKEIKIINHGIDSLTKAKRSVTNYLEGFYFLYECVHSKVVQGKIEPEFLATIKMPAQYKDNHPLVQAYVLYGLEFSEAFSKNNHWQDNYLIDIEYIHQNCQDPTHILPEFLFILIRNSIDFYFKTNSADFDKLQYLLSLLEQMEPSYRSDPAAKLNIDKLNFNLNVLLLNAVFAKEPMKYSGNAIKSIAQLYKFYENYNLMNGSKAIQLGKTAVYFQQIYPAIELMQPFAHDDSVMAYILPLGYQHISTDGSQTWYNDVIQAAEEMDTTIWCNMFFDECKIPFQAFDYEPLRTLFCERCMEKSNFIQNLLGKKQMK